MSRAYSRYTDEIGATMRQAYEVERLSIAGVAERFEVSPTTAYNWLKRAETVMRPVTPQRDVLPGGGRQLPAVEPALRLAAHNGPPLSRVSRSVRSYVTTCPACRCGIYTGDATKRDPARHLGPLHDWC